MIWNFIGYKFIVFEQKKPAAEIPPSQGKDIEQTQPPGRKIV
jgi:hypothetical protein